MYRSNAGQVQRQCPSHQVIEPATLRPQDQLLSHYTTLPPIILHCFTHNVKVQNSL
uniref:Uncharacterized protein n=1 Tax=Anguilla anguilla TaxID=7936 RepID=A0A0E9RQE4_ANGAN